MHEKDRDRAATMTGGFFRRCTKKISMIGVGPVPVGSLFLLFVLYVLPLVLVWNAIDFLPRWFDKVALLGLSIYTYGVHVGRKDVS
ncbi:hypothetical protein [Ralstonia pickettii]|uniref:hypothetical protein n=1 Tax=Ralstonia pickettii TaxID=329 RepID=UPI0015BCCEDE|nr:hypothetical protein [Ralstonia pickettii]NWK46028.1 hypothetical protein [Ralstonia pickettii]